MEKFLRLFFLGFIFFSAFSFANEKTQISFDGNKIIYHGELTKEANETVFVIYKNNIEKIRWISIKSIGGEVNAGLDLAEFISENGINIEVAEYCLSSCANYVFPAANEKLITNYALIGFHGGTAGMAANMADYINTLPESEREVTQKKLDEYGQITSAREASFFKKIEVDQKITTLGQGDEYKKYSDIGGYVGWYYSINDLNKLGVKNVSVLSPPWMFKQLSEKSKFFKVKV
jgi:ATP-dependent protease ClpP protease subunit